MPNWCQNEVTVYFDDEEVAEGKYEEFKQYVSGKEDYHGRCAEKYTYQFNAETGKSEMVEKEEVCKYDSPFKDTCDKRRDMFDFQSIYPMPNGLEGTSSPTNVVDTQEEVDKWKEEHPKWEAMGMGRPITQAEYDTLMSEHGVSNWYDWCSDNWGTKWNCNTVEFEEDGNLLRYEFDTAWSPPEGIYWKLKELFPSVHISWFFREEGMEMAGYINPQY